MSNEANTSIEKICDEAPEEMIRYIRGQWVIIDRDLADLYNVSTKALNQQVKRNIERFPPNFMFKLNVDEFHELVTKCDRFKRLKHSSVMPNAFTEQGISMLSAVLKSPTAINVSIRIIESFVRLRKLMLHNASLYQRIERIEHKQLETDKRISEILDIIGNTPKIPSQGIFFDGQIYDAYTFVTGLIRKAQHRIILIDNYIDDTVLTMLNKRKDQVSAKIYTSQMTKEMELDIKKHNAQYKSIEIHRFSKAHDRFLIIDEDVYLIGASIKDMGKKWFGFTLIHGVSVTEITNRLNTQ